MRPIRSGDPIANQLVSRLVGWKILRTEIQTMSPYLFAARVLAAHKAGAQCRDGPRDPFLSVKPFKALEVITPALKRAIIQVRELIFEQVRANAFPDRPSRQRCAYLIPDDRSSLKYWVEQLMRPGSRLMKVRVSGSAFRANDVFLTLDMRSPDDWAQQAANYWGGIPVGQEQPNDELLFVGHMEFVEEIVVTIKTLGETPQ